MSPYCRCLNHRIPGPHELECPLYQPPLATPLATPPDLLAPKEA